MFEFDKYDPNRPGERTVPNSSYEPFSGGQKRALLLWGEHCIECAAPDCFASCDLYDARPDERCRRFQYGIYRNTAYRSAQGAGAEVVFRRWGKLEARGNATMLPIAMCNFAEAAIGSCLPLANLVGKSVRRMGAPIRWSYLAFGAMERFNRWLLKRRSPASKPEAFVVEIFNPQSAAIDIVLNMAIDRSQLKRKLTSDQVPRPFTRKLSLVPGYNRIDIPLADFAAVVESDLPFNISLTPLSADGTHLVFLTLDFITYSVVPAARTISTGKGRDQRPEAKCVVFDLDNTLWDGVLLEGEVKLKPGVLEIFKELDQRGILISVASKNSHEHAMACLARHGLDDFLLFPQINWARKSESIAAIAKRIDINLDTFVFVDDSPFEREEVGKSHPQVEVLAETALASLLAHPRLKGSNTAEARSRRAMYQKAIEREEAAVSFGDDYLAFLRSCEIVVELLPVSDEHLERIIELVQRTNQLNFSGRKYSREAIERILESDDYGKHVVSCSDKYGSYGVVGFAISEPIEDGVRIVDFMLSCRVQGKFVEQALFDYLVRRTNPPAKVIEVNYVRTDKNALAEAVLRKIGFPVDAPGDGRGLRMNLTPTTLSVDFLTVREHGARQIAPQLPAPPAKSPASDLSAV